MKAQTVFNKAVTGLFKQGCKSRVEDDDCLYRGPNNTRCAVGMLISNTNYSPEMENKSVFTLYEASLLPIHLVPHLCLLKDLQTTHDDEDVNYWPKELLLVANRHNLKFDHIKELHNANRNLLAGN